MRTRGEYRYTRDGVMYHRSIAAEAFVRRQSPGRPPVGLSADVDLNWPGTVERRLTGMWPKPLGLAIEAQHLTRTHRKVSRAYEEGHIGEDELERHKRWFVREGRLLLRLAEFANAKDREGAPPPRSNRERQRRLEWLAMERAELQRQETARQLRLLREGHQTLRAIRKHLHDPVSSRPQESRPEKTSPTS